jgi:tetratricopeptide (TPR) repeat protein
MTAAVSGSRDLAARAGVVPVLVLAMLLVLECQVRADEARTPDTPAADEDLVRATLAYRKAPDSVWLGLILLELDIRHEKLDDAVRLADELITRFPSDPQVWAQHGFLMFMRQEFKRAVASFTQALRFQIWTPDQVRNLRFALADSALADRNPLIAYMALEPLGDGPEAAVQIRLGKIKLAKGDTAGAAAAARRAKESAATEVERDEAETLLEQSTAPVDNGGFAQLTQGYAHLRQHDDAAALAAFQRGFALGAGKAAHYADAAYAAKRLGNNALAIHLFRHSLDVDRDEHAFDPGRAFGFRREVEAMSRTFGFSLGTPYQAGGLDVLQGGIEGYWQPSGFGYRNGRTVQFFLRGYENFRNGVNGATGLRTAQSSLGIRYKPLVAHNLVFTLERLIPIGSLALGDWLVRLGYSAGGGTDLDIARSHWAAWQIYSEAAYFTNAARLLVSGEAHYGITLPVARIPRLTIQGYPLAAADYDNLTDPQLALAAGVGVGLRYWFRETPYTAPASWFDLQVQYRIGLAERARGLLVRALIFF